MDRLLKPISGWLAAVVLVAVTIGALSIRGRLADDTAADTPSQVATPSEEPAPPASDRRVAGVPLRADEPERRTQAPRPVPAPTATPAPTPAPPPPTPVPVAAGPTPDNGAGGGLAPRTAPPGWTPPATIPGDIWTTGGFGQTLSAGGITVAATRLPLDGDASGCDDGNPLPSGYVRVGFQVTTSWAGFSIPNFGAEAPNQGLTTCWLGSPLVSGSPHQVYLQLPAQQAAATLLRLSYFPNGMSPAYIFEFR